MRRITLIFVFALLFNFASVFSQARKELNFGLIGINYEIPVHPDITIAPGAGTNGNLDWLTVGVKANYYFDNLFGISDAAWDVYGGAGVGYAFDMRENEDNNGHGNDDGLDLGLHAGGRWFWNDKWGVYLELSYGNTSEFSPGIGLTMKL
ncbi:MAG TPA: hypothetical protein VIV55_06020 [Flavobacterium sp.]